MRKEFKMNKMVPVLSLVFVLGGGSLLTASSSYNRLVPYEEAVNVSYAEYQNQLKRQADLIPNFAEVVKSYWSSGSDSGSDSGGGD